MPPVHPAIDALPLSDGAAATVLALDGGPWALPVDAVTRWGGSASPFRGQGRAAWLLATGRGALLASVNTQVAGGPLGMFGWLRLHPALSFDARVEVACGLLAEARAFARQHGATRLRGPMTFSTWLPYRVLGDDSPADEPGFPGEGVEPAEMNALYVAAGLHVCDRYVTRAVPEGVDHWDAALAREAEVAARRGDRLHVRQVAAGEVGSLLPHVHRWLNASFAGTPYFTPVAPEALADHLVGRAPQGVEPVHLVAVDGSGTPHGVLVGFIHLDRGILKTVAVSPAARGGRAAMALTFGFHRLLRARGITRAWHAQMHEAANSARMSAKHARPVRRYVLYGDAVD